MTSFTRFVEMNDHEGETWTFWLQRDDNEDALADLKAKLDAEDDGYDCPYALDLDVTLNEHDVDVLCDYGGQGYMAYHTKVSGCLVVPEGLGVAVGDDALYKGGICLFIKPCDD